MWWNGVDEMFCFASLWVREIEKLEEDLWNDYETVCQEFNHRNGEENDRRVLMLNNNKQDNNVLLPSVLH